MRWPILVFVPLAALFAVTDWDLSIARFVFFDAAHATWIGAHRWWAESLVHIGGRWAVRVVVLTSIALWAGSYLTPRLRQARRPAAYFAIASVLGVGIVGLLKTVTNVDCPWDLIPFGGHFPVIPLFAHRPDTLRAAHCFPAAHASSGYALVALYFVCRERSRALAHAGLALGVLCGVAFGIAQQSRGAHFASHDLWSAFLLWLTAASVYVFGFRMRLYPAHSPHERSPFPRFS